MAQTRNYGWKPDLPDPRDIHYYALYRIPKKLPEKVDLRALCPAVEDQGKLGSCTSHALTGAVELLENKDGLSVVQMSRLFLYYNERVIENTTSSDNGARIRDGIKSLVKQGVCSEDKWPYLIENFQSKPTQDCYREALDHQITSYQRIDTLDQMLSCLADGFPFVFGFTVYESFESQSVAKTGIVNMPTEQESPLGGHAVLAVGYDNHQKRFIVRNSWSPNWGIKGYFTIPYDYLADHELAKDMWTIRRGENI